MKVVKYACSHGVTNTIRFFQKEFPNLMESTVLPWVSKYKEEIKKKSAECVIISQTRGRPLLLPVELDKKLYLFITNMRTADGTINKHVIYEVTSSLWEEVDQVLSKFVPTENVAMTETGSKHFQKKAEMINGALLLLCQKQSLERYCLFN